MAFAFIQQQVTTNGGGSQTTVTVTLTVTAGSLLYVSITGNTPTTDVDSVVDSKGNSYTPVREKEQSRNIVWQRCYYALNAVAGSTTVTVALSGATDATDVRVWEFSVPVAGAILQTSNANENQSNTPTSNTITTTDAVQLLIGSVGTEGFISAPAGAGWTGLVITTPNSDADEYQITSSAGIYAATFNNSLDTYACVIAAFTEATPMAIVQMVFSARLVDSNGHSRACHAYYAIDDAISVATLIGRLETFADDIAAVSDAGISRLSLSIDDQEYSRSATPGGASIEQIGLLNFAATGSARRWAQAIPAFSNSKIVGSRINLSDGAVSALIDDWTSGNFTNDHSQEIVGFADALVSFRKERKQLQRASFERA